MKKNNKSRLWGDRFSTAPAQSALTFLSGRDVSWIPPSDYFLLSLDIEGSIAHARMLEKKRIITKTELVKILKGLARLSKDGLTLSPGQEDVHTAVEISLGEAGAALHTARSRNDQVALDTRLFLKKEVLSYEALLSETVLALLDVAGKNTRSPMPGYTHHRRAMVTTFGHYLFSVACALWRDRQRFRQWLELFDKSPLGSAASYGTSFPIDRRHTASILGFAGVEPSSLDPIQNRWEPEASFAFAVCAMMNHLSSFAQTMILLSSQEFGLVRLPDGFCTGSSMMPQKKNPDFLELAKGKASVCGGHLLSLLSAGQASFMGYNRDSQVTKQLVIDIVLESRPLLELLPRFLAGVRPDRERMAEEAGRGFITSTHALESFVKASGMPFRKAKRLVERAVKISEENGFDGITYDAYLAAGGSRKAFSAKELEDAQDPLRIIDSYSSLGSPNPKMLGRQIAGLRKEVISSRRRGGG